MVIYNITMPESFSYRRLALSVSKLTLFVSIIFIAIGISFFLYFKFFGAEAHEVFFKWFPTSIADIEVVGDFSPCTVELRQACITLISGERLVFEGSSTNPNLVKISEVPVTCSFAEEYNLEETLVGFDRLRSNCSSN